MKDIIQELWNGEVYPAKNRKFVSEGLKALEKEIERQKQIFLGGLPTERQKAFMDLESYLIQYTDQYAQDAFRQGFQLGGKLVMQIVANKKD